MKVCRISKIKGFGGIIGGKDIGNILSDGHVYEIREIMGELMIIDLGKHAKMNKQNVQTFSTVMMDGTYLLTEKEHS